MQFTIITTTHFYSKTKKTIIICYTCSTQPFFQFAVLSFLIHIQHHYHSLLSYIDLRKIDSINASHQNTQIIMINMFEKDKEKDKNKKKGDKHKNTHTKIKTTFRFN